MPDNRSKLIGRGLPGHVTPKVGDLTDGDTLEWDDTTLAWIIGAPAPGVSELDELSDVTLTAEGDDEFLQYDSGSNQWINQTPVEAELVHPVLLTTPAEDDLLAYDNASSMWINQTAGQAGLVIPSELHDAVTLAGTGTYISLAGQIITVDPITESDISDLQTYGDVFKVGTPVLNEVAFWSGDGTLDHDDHLFYTPELLEIHVDTNTVNNVGLLFLDPDSSLNPEGWQWCTGQAGIFDGTLFLSSDPDDAVNTRDVTFLPGGRPTFGFGIALAPNTSLSDENLGALAYYMPRDNVGTHRAIMSYVSNSGSGQASQFSWETYVYGNSGLQLRRDIFFKTNANYFAEFLFHGVFRLFDTSDNQTNFLQSTYVNIQHDGDDVLFSGANITDYEFTDASGSYNFDNDVDVTGNIILSGTVDGIDIATDVAANTAKVSNVTHTGEVTGATALSLDITAVTAQPASGALIGADTIIVNDGGVLSEATLDQVATFTGSGGGASALDDLSDVTLTTPATGGLLYKSAGDWLDINDIIIVPGVSLVLGTGSDFIDLDTGDNNPVSITNTTNVSLSNRNNALNIGSKSGAHLALGDFDIQAKQSTSNGASLSINRFGGAIILGETDKTQLNVVSTGITITRDTNLVPALSLNGTGTAQALLTTRSTSGGIRWKWEEALAQGKIVQMNGAGSEEDDWMLFDLDGRVGQFFNGTEVTRTITAATGGFEVNNTLTGAGFERVLTTADIGATNSLDDLSDVTLTTPATGSFLYKSAGDWIDTDIMLVTANGVELNNSGSAITVDIHADGFEIDSNLIARGDGGGIELRWDQSQSSGYIKEVDSSGAFVGNWIHFGAGIHLTLFYDNVAVVETLPAASGGLRANNTLTGAGLERVLTTGDIDDVTLAGTPDYITISGQVITRGLINLTTDVTGDLPVADGGTGSSTQAGARTNLDVDQAGTDNSTDVTFAGTGTYISLAGQVITVDPITESDITDLQTYAVAGGAFHDGFSDFVSGEHFLQSAISITESQISDLQSYLLTVAVSDLDNGTDGELITWSAAGVAETVAVGTATHVLTSNGTGLAPTFQVAPGGGGALDDLSDVTISGTPADNELLAYNTGTGEFINQTPAEAGLDPAGTDNSTDVTLGGTPDYITISGQVITRNLIVATDDLSATGTKTSATFLRGDDTWATPPAGGSNALDDLTDVTLTTPITGAVLYKSAGDWLDTDAIEIDPAAALIIRDAGGTVFATRSHGIDVTARGRVGTATIDIEGAGSNIDAIIRMRGDSGGVGLVWDEGLVEALLIHYSSTAGKRGTILSATIDAETSLYFNDLVRFTTTAGGAEVLGVLLDLDNSGAATAMELRLRNSEGGGLIRADGDELTFWETDSAGATSQQWMRFAPGQVVGIAPVGGTVTINALGTGSKLDVVGTGAVDLTDRSNTMNVGTTSTVHLAFDSNTVQAKGSATTAADLLLNRLGGDVDLYSGGVATARTVGAANGGLEANNTDTGGGFERVLTTSDLCCRVVKVKTATQTLDDDPEDGADLNYGNTLTDDDDLVGWTLDAASFYIIKGKLWMEVADEAVDAKIALTVSQTPVYTSWGFEMTGSIVSSVNWDSQFNSAITASMNIEWNGASEENVRSQIVLDGYIETHASLSTTLNLQWAQRVNSGQFLTLYRGSWLSLEKIA